MCSFAVVSHRETWIETSSLNSQLSLSLVVSHRETWIETKNFVQSIRPPLTSSLTERRGLKPAVGKKPAAGWGVVSHRETWIETSTYPACKRSWSVVSHRETWIETSFVKALFEDVKSSLTERRGLKQEDLENRCSSNLSSLTERRGLKPRVVIARIG